jgi:lysyl-tRNA synthetase class 2
MKKDETLHTPTDSGELGEAHEPREFQVRVEKVKKLQARGIDPWPPAKPVTAQCAQIKDEYHEQSDHVYAVAGRLMTIRVHGKTAFAHLQDSSCRLQIYLKVDIVGEQQFKIFEDLIDPGDI